MSSLTREGRRKLRALAKQRRGVAVSVHYSKGKMKFRYLGNWAKKKKRR